MSMDNAVVYIGSDGLKPLSREALIYENIEMALAQMASLERHLISREDSARGRAPLGLVDVILQDKVIAIGMLAHAMLADFRKRSVLAGDHGLDGDAQGTHDIEELIWSCANTSRAIAIGDGAWRALQMLPIADRRHYDVPPLKLPQSNAAVKAQNLLIINHDSDGRLARELAALANTDKFTVTGCGLLDDLDGQGSSPILQSWTPQAGIHVHVGLHTVKAERLRLIDSWNCGRVTVQLLPPRPSAGWETSSLLIEDEANGFICHSTDAVLAVCREVRRDPVLGRTLVGAGHRSAAQLTRVWTSIVQDLLLDQ